jgi:lipid A 3-O-deacylase
VNILQPLNVLVACLFFLLPFSVHAEDLQPAAASALNAEDSSPPETTGIWSGALGHGFRAGTQTFGLGIGMGYGIKIFGTRDRHDLLPMTVSYGRMVSDVMGGDHWYRGNFEVRGEVFLAPQVNSGTYWTIGLTPHLRYNFATGTRWIPYVDVGVGIAFTEIRAPDLGASFQFNEQAAVGVNYFFTDDLAVNFEIHFLHLSSAGISKPNQGVNTVGPCIGVEWFF